MSGLRTEELLKTESPGVASAASDLLRLDAAAKVASIGDALRHHVWGVLHRRGLVVGLSGGIDSSVCAALAVEAIGPTRVFGLLMPERNSSPESLELARELADQLGIEAIVEDLSDVLEAAGCYRRYDEAVRRVVPEYGPDWASKILLPGNRLESDRLNVYYIAVKPPEGEIRTVRLTSQSYLEIVAATNFKQRTRKMMEYFHADRLHYAVIGTPNRVEYDQGFFVKGGDGLADVKPIAHLYKTQVYQLADHLNVPEAIRKRRPTTDTYSLPQSQEEFYFSLPALTMDLVLYARNAGWSPELAAGKIGLPADQITRAYADIEQKRSTTYYLHAGPWLVEPVPEIDAG